MTLFGVIFVDTPSSSRPLRHPYSLLPRGLFLLWPQALTQVNGRVSNTVGLFKQPSSLTHFFCHWDTCAQFTYSLTLMLAFLEFYWIYFNQLALACSLQSVTQTLWYWAMLERLFYMEILSYHLILSESCSTQATAGSQCPWKIWEYFSWLWHGGCVFFTHTPYINLPMYYPYIKTESGYGISTIAV